MWSMCYAWCSFFFQVLCLVQGGAGQLCSWVASNLTWAAGARLELSISNIQQVLVLVVMSLLLVVISLLLVVMSLLLLVMSLLFVVISLLLNVVVVCGDE